MESSELSHDLVVGADGLIGAALLASLRDAGSPAWGTTRRDGSSDLPLDLARIAPDWRPPGKIGVAYLAGAATQIARCESDPAATEAVNVEGAVRVAEAVVAAGGFIVFLSTSLVFDGSQPHVAADAPLCPVTMYGKQKAAAEAALLALEPDVAVVRITKVVAPHTGVFSAWRLALDEGRTIEPFTDMVMAPVSLALTVAALTAIGRRREGGIWQLSGPADVTYADAARMILASRGLSDKLLHPTTARERGLASYMTPRHTTLDTHRLRAELALRPPPAESVLNEVFGPS